MMKLLSIILTLISFNSFACQCFHVSPEEAAKESKHVFLARIYSVEDLAKLPNAKDTDTGVRAKIEIYETIKGKPQQFEFLYSGYGHGDCGLGFTVGDRYLFITSNDKVSICGSHVKNFSPWSGEDKALYEKLKKANE